MAQVSVNNNEYQIQKLFHDWCQKQDFILASWHVPNGFTSNAKNGYLMKQIGLLRGVFDYWVITNKPEIMAIEFKTDKGELSQDQIKFKEVLDKANIPNAICRSPFEATQFVKERMKKLLDKQI